MVRVLAALQRSEAAPRLVEPVPALLQALGAGARHPLLRWLLPLCRTWCALLQKSTSGAIAVPACFMWQPSFPSACAAADAAGCRHSSRA